jgi:hypothetical protein
MQKIENFNLDCMAMDSVPAQCKKIAKLSLRVKSCTVTAASSVKVVRIRI